MLQQQQQGGSSSTLQQHRRSGSVSGSGPVMIDQASLRKLNETVPAATLRELGIEEGDSLFVRSSYAYDHVDSGAGVQDLGEEVSTHVKFTSNLVKFAAFMCADWHSSVRVWQSFECTVHKCTK
jgi:hypothetical protein